MLEKPEAARIPGSVLTGGYDAGRGNASCIFGLQLYSLSQFGCYYLISTIYVPMSISNIQCIL